MTTVLTVNAGSSSLKFAAFDDAAPILRGAIESIDDAPKASAKGADGGPLDAPKIDGTGHEAVLPALFAWLRNHVRTPVAAIGHRVVHGGDRFTGPVRADAAALQAMDALIPLAPLHQPHNIAAIRAAGAAMPGIPQVACFDTAFHQAMPGTARRLALPDALGYRRYGFHGLSYAWTTGHLSPRLAAGRTVVAHLGSGASLCALLAGRSVETTMSATPLDGLVMGTRCGALDPGVVLDLVRRQGIDAAEHLLYHQAGLLGVSGVGGDMRALHASADLAAAAAIDLFVHRLVASIAAMAAALGGIDGLVFTGGIGEHDPAIRAAACQRLGWLGIALDPDAAAPGRIDAASSKVELWVIPTDEEAVIARETLSLLG